MNQDLTDYEFDMESLLNFDSPEKESIGVENILQKIIHTSSKSIQFAMHENNDRSRLVTGP